MPHTRSAGAQRQARLLTKQFTAQLTGRIRGPDHADNRRVPRRNSYDVADRRAQPWRKFGDGSVAQGIIHSEALLQAAEELRHLGWKDYPLAEIRETRARYAALSAELEALGDVTPIGRPATLRQELSRLAAFLAGARQRLRLVDLRVLRSLLHRVDFATGVLFPAIETIAGDAGCHRNSVVGALRRLKVHGLVDWVRRSVRTGNEGEFAPQREQTSNAYFFDHKATMQPCTWQRYWQILLAKLKRLGAVPAAVAAPPSPAIASPELRAALARVETLVSNAST